MADVEEALLADVSEFTISLGPSCAATGPPYFYYVKIFLGDGGPSVSLHH
jgi:hypothetical protein